MPVFLVAGQLVQICWGSDCQPCHYGAFYHRGYRLYRPFRLMDKKELPETVASFQTHDRRNIDHQHRSSADDFYIRVYKPRNLGKPAID